YLTNSTARVSSTPISDISTLSLHDALPIWPEDFPQLQESLGDMQIDGIMNDWVLLALFACAFLVPTIFSLTAQAAVLGASGREKDRKSTRLNSSHVSISYAVFCLKKKKTHD